MVRMIDMMKTTGWILLNVLIALVMLVACSNNEPETIVAEPTPVPTPRPTIVVPTPTPVPTPAPSPTPSGPSFSLFRDNIEMMDAEGIRNYAENVTGKEFSGWVGRVHAIIEFQPGHTIVEIEMDYRRVKGPQSVPDVIMNSLTQKALGQLRIGQIVNFSGVVETIADINRRKNAIIVKKVSIFGVDNSS